MGVLSELGSNLIPLSPDISATLWAVVQQPPKELYSGSTRKTYYFRGDPAVLAERIRIGASDTGPMLFGLEGEYFPYLDLYAAEPDLRKEVRERRLQGSGRQAWFAPSMSAALVDALLRLACDKYLYYFQYSLQSTTMRLYKGDPEFLTEVVRRNITTIQI
ncbi:hypothetical protein CCB81_12870 [Armatimonadetes bacterium Uphvl-Ar2]|nr:hypothetical protein CCB81_12870 [Armatimonadetes bacterium Uphvl-Ar2]